MLNLELFRPDKTLELCDPDVNHPLELRPSRSSLGDSSNPTGARVGEQHEPWRLKGETRMSPTITREDSAGSVSGVGDLVIQAPTCKSLAVNTVQ